MYVFEGSVLAKKGLASYGGVTPSVGTVATQGIAFPATQSASSNANTLDDYEEGTWTPSSGTTNMTITESATAVYVKVGQLVMCTCYVAIVNNTGGNVYGVQINGLPFTCSGAYYGGIFKHYDGGAGVGWASSAYMQTGQTYGYLNWNGALANGATNYSMWTFVYRATA